MRNTPFRTGILTSELPTDCSSAPSSSPSGSDAVRLADGQRVQRMLVLVVLDRHLAVEPRPIHRIGIRIENHRIDVPNHDGQRRQDRLVPVNGDGNVDPPSWHPFADEAP